MNRMTSLVAATVMAAGTALAPSLATAPAQADTPRCVAKTEFKKVKKGWPIDRVHRLFDTKGKQSTFTSSGYGYPASQSRDYNGCPSYSMVNISYDKKNGVWRVTDKFAVW